MSWFSVLIFLLLAHINTQAAINNNFEQNIAQWGEPYKTEVFSSKKGFSGYANYSVDKNLRLIAYFSNNIVRSEHLTAKEGDKVNLNRDQCRQWATKMFDQKFRGSFRKQLEMPRVQGHFFDKGLITYEYLVDKGRKNGFCGVKVLLYDKNAKFSQINPKAYI